MENFTPFSAFFGGMLIGTSATILLLFNGKILGVSGIMAKALCSFKEKATWQISFLAGLVGGTFFYRLIFAEGVSITIETSTPVLVLAGLLVGFGTNLGSGCTSGHGICGIARFSKRSIVATLVFMSAGILTVYLVKLLLGGS